MKAAAAAKAAAAPTAAPPDAPAGPDGATQPAGAGSRPRVEAARAAAGKPAAADEDDPVVPDSAPVSAAAKAYAAKAREVLVLELQVQGYEANTLGREDPETLGGYRKTRRLRIEKDKFFRSLAGQFSIKPLAMPDPLAAPDASPAALKFFSALQRAYESTRELRPLDQMQQHNQSFLKTEDWAARDRATAIRDELMDRGVMFTTLTQRAWDIRQGTLGDDAIPDLLATLHAEVPEPEEKESDLAVLVLNSPELRDHVMTELTGLLAVPLAPPASPPPAEELTTQVVELQKSLLEKAGLTTVAEQDRQLEAELDKVNAELETAPTKTALDKKVKIVSKRSELQAQWYGTDPDAELYETLAGAQEQLIRRRMLDLGTMGSLFGARLDSSVAERQATDATSWGRWTLLKDQRDLLTELDEARPAKTPLDNLVPPPLYGLDMLEKAKKEQAAKLAALGKSGGKNQLFGKGKGVGSFGKSAPKPTAHPKAKAGAGKPGAKPGAKQAGYQQKPKQGKMPY